MSGDECRRCGRLLDDFGQCWACDEEGSREVKPTTTRPTDRALYAVAAERHRQDRKWGKQNHDPLFWLAILGEEFGEVAKEITEAEAARQRGEGGAQAGRLNSASEELIQLAAVALAMAESMERNQDVAIGGEQ